MLFNSVQFVLFFTVVTTLYYLLSHKWRWVLLLGASCYFYMAFVPVYILILFFTIIIDFYAGIYIEESKGKTRKKYLILSLFANIGLLLFFKYFNFFNSIFSHILSTGNMSNSIPYLDIILPIGLSFHTFQAMSYTIEVYRGNQKAERHFGIYALYVMFYPQLVAGPIERPQNILHQLKKFIPFDKENLNTGIQLMAWGFFKKIVIADRCAVLVNSVYSDPTAFSGFTNLMATFFFSIQIYCDFSGYSDIAIGSAKTMGIDLMKNFNSPYFAKSVTEFWQKWHISLSSWFRDYLYIPLGGNKFGEFLTIRNVLIVFLVSGLWHGANWTFIIWGGMHGFIILIERILNFKKLDSYSSNLIKILRIGYVFFIVNFIWILFRATSVEQAVQVIKKIVFDFKIDKNSISETVFQFTGDSSSIDHFIVIIVMIAFMFMIEYFSRINNTICYFKNARWNFITNIIVILFTIAFGISGSNSFIYFQF